MYDRKLKELQQLLRLEKLGWIDLLFGDETGFSLEPNIPYGWLPVGEQTGIVSEHKHVGNVFGLLSTKTQGVMHWYDKNIDSEFVIQCLDDLTERIDKPTVVVLDNAPWHRSQKVLSKFPEWNRNDLYIFFLPTYSPHLNLIEIFWRKIKYEWLEPEHFVSPIILKQAVLNILRNYGSQFQINFSKNFLLSI